MSVWPSTAVLSIDTHPDRGFNAWAVASTLSGGDTTITADGIAAADTDITTHVLPHLIDLATQAAPGGLLLLVTRQAVLRALEAAWPADGPSVTFETETFYFDTETRVAKLRTCDLIRDAADNNIAYTAHRLTVAVDGSYSRHTHTGGWGYVTSDWTHGTGSWHTVDGSLAAELEAITHAVTHLPKWQPLHILSDSQDAIAIATGRRTYRGPATHRLLQRLTGRDVTFEWVRGHDGDPMNETAHRLAMAARRREEWTSSDAAYALVCSTIVAEGRQGVIGLVSA